MSKCLLLSDYSFLLSKISSLRINSNILRKSNFILQALVAAVLFTFPVSVGAKPLKQNLPILQNTVLYSRQQNPPNFVKTNKPQFVPDEIILKLKSEAEGNISITNTAKSNVSTGLASLDKLHKKFGSHKMKRVLKKSVKSKRKLSPKTQKLRQGLLRIYIVKLKKGTDVSEAVEEYMNDPNIEYAEPNYIYQTTSTIPNDPSFSQQWGLHNTGQSGGTPDADIDAPEAWDIETGDPRIVIAVVDTGVDWDHPDLAANIWTNPGEIENNGIDDDGNGFVDDTRGWDFVTATGSVLEPVDPGEDPGPEDNNPMDFHGHGTHVSGIIGAVGNNGIGVTGVAWNCKIMAVRAGYSLGGYGFLKTSDTLNAITYAADNAANIISMSFGSYYRLIALQDVIDYAYESGVVLVASAGNNSCNCAHYPSSFDNVISVAANDKFGNIPYFSNFGRDIDVSAPGRYIYSTLFDDSYVSWSGTSMAAPHVAGVAGLILSRKPFFTNDEVTQIIKLSAEDEAVDQNGLPGRDNHYGYGRLNAYNALQFDNVCKARIESPTPSGYVKGTVDIIGTAAGRHFDHYKIYYGNGIYPSNWTQIGTSSYAPVSDNLLGTWDVTTLSDGDYMLKLVVVDTDSNEFTDKICIKVNNNPNIYYVPDDYSTIQVAINVVSNGSTVIVREGTYYETIDFNGKRITVQSEKGAALTIIDAQSSGSAVSFDYGETADSVLDGFTLTGGTGSRDMYGWFSGGGGLFL